MSRARDRRLMRDKEMVDAEFTSHPFIFVRVLGNPALPERYMVTYQLKGLKLEGKQIVESMRHEAEIYLHADYPRSKPKCIMHTPIFHPNFGDHICIGDDWAAGENLVSIIIQIGRMICYQEYNPKSPLNAVAARWARENEKLFPLFEGDLYQAEISIDLDFGGDTAGPPKNGAPGPEDDMDIELLGPSSDQGEDLEIELG